MNSELRRRHGLAIDEMDDNDRRWARRVGFVACRRALLMLAQTGHSQSN